MTIYLSGKVALVTGGSRGIGKAVASRLAGAGARVALVDVVDPKPASAGEPATEAPLNAFFTEAPAGLAILDADLRFVRINRRLAEMHVLPVDDHLGRMLAEVLPGLADVLEPILRQVLGTGLPALNIEITTEDPRSPADARVWRVSAFPVGPVQEDPTGVGVVVVDITDSKRMEQQARLDGRYLAALIESSPLGMVTLDPSSRVVSANVAFENLFLLPREEAIGRDLELIAPPDRHEEARLLTQRTQLGEQLRADVRRRRRDGVEVLVRMHSSPIVLDGKHVGAHVIYEHLG